jgi:subtilisin family serine protease
MTFTRMPRDCCPLERWTMADELPAAVFGRIRFAPDEQARLRELDPRLVTALTVAAERGEATELGVLVGVAAALLPETQREQKAEEGADRGGKAGSAVGYRLPGGDLARGVHLAFGYAVGPRGAIIEPGEVPPFAQEARFASARLLFDPEAAGSGDEGRRAVLGAALEQLMAAHDAGLRVELAPTLRPSLDASLAAMRAAAADLPPLSPPEAPDPRDGRGVLLGAVDYGLDFAHPAFRGPDGRTRLEFLWDHNNAARGAPAGLGLSTAPPAYVPQYGRWFDEAALNAALQVPSPGQYWALAYDPEANPYAPPGPAGAGPVHGTHVLGVAGGRGCPGVAPGVAPGARLAFVHLRPGELRRSLAQQNGGDVLDGVCAILRHAEELRLPAAVTLALSTNSGAHDGTNVLEAAFDSLLAPGLPRAIVVSAGNALDARRHAAGSVRDGTPRAIRWEFEPGDTTANHLDIWYINGGPDPSLVLTVIAPDGSRWTPPAPLGGVIPGPGGRPVGLVTTGHAPAPEGGVRQQIFVSITPAEGEEAELWRIELSIDPELAAMQPGIEVDFHAWIDRDDLTGAPQRTQSGFAEEDADPRCSLGSLACGRRTFAVGAYYHIPPAQPAAWFSSAGPTRDGRAKPDAAAPGVQVRAPNARGGQLACPGAPGLVPLVAPMTGTSVSAPHVAGLAALVLQTPADNLPKDAVGVGDVMRATTQPTPAEPPGMAGLPPPAALAVTAAAVEPGAVPPRAWHARLGFGRVDGGAVLRALP